MMAEGDEGKLFGQMQSRTDTDKKDGKEKIEERTVPSISESKGSSETTDTESSKASDSPQVTRKTRSRVVRIIPKPTAVKKFQKSMSVFPMVPGAIYAQRYEWESYFFLEPGKFAMKQTELSRKSDTLPAAQMPAKVPSKMPPSTALPSIKDPVDPSEMAPKDSSTLPQMLPKDRDVLPSIASNLEDPVDPGEKAPKDTGQLLPKGPNILPPIVSKSKNPVDYSIVPLTAPKDSSTRSLMPSNAPSTKLLTPSSLKGPVNPSKLPPLLPKGPGSSKKASSSELPTEGQKLPSIKKPPLRKSPTWPAIMFHQTESKYSSKPPPKKDYTKLQQKDSSTLLLKVPKKMLLALPIKPPISPEKPWKLARIEILIEPMSIAKENPEKVSNYIAI